MKKILYLLAVIIITLAVSSCEKDVNDKDMVDNEIKNEYPEEPIFDQYGEEALSYLIKVQNDFAFRDFKAVLESNIDNIAVNSYSDFILLSLLANADGENAKTVTLNAMGLNAEFKPSVINDANKYILSLISDNLIWHENGVYLCESAVWKGRDVQFSSKFSDILNAYGWTVYDKSPVGENGMSAINKWAEINTNAFLPLVPEYLNSPYEESFLPTVASYYALLWATPFTDNVVRRTNFNSYNGKTESMTMLTYDKSVKRGYFQSEDVEIVEIPYQQHKASMYIIMPSDVQKFESYAIGLDNNKFSSLMSNMNETKLEIAVPQVDIASHYDLNNIIVRDGYDIQFSEITSGGRGYIFKKLPVGANYRINRTGSIVNQRISPDAAEKVIDTTAKLVEINRPFIFVVKDNKTGMIITVGAVKNM